jgi:hypothetical protein
LLFREMNHGIADFRGPRDDVRGSIASLALAGGAQGGDPVREAAHVEEGHVGNFPATEDLHEDVAAGRVDAGDPADDLGKRLGRRHRSGRGGAAGERDGCGECGRGNPSVRAVHRAEVLAPRRPPLQGAEFFFRFVPDKR